MAFGMDIYAIIIISFCIGQQQKLEGEAAYRLGLSYEKTGDGETALLVSIDLTGDCCFVAFCHLLMIFTTVWTQIRPDKMFDFLIVFLKDFFLKITVSGRYQKPAYSGDCQDTSKV